MTLGEKQEQFAIMLGRLLMYIHSLGYRCRIGDVWADDANKTAREIYKYVERLIKNNVEVFYDEVECPDEIFSNVFIGTIVESIRRHSGNSNHYKKLAVDINLFKDGVFLTETEDHAIFGEFWKQLGGTWGGDFPDPDGNHYEFNPKEG